jgi:putative ABC transport system permease protein
VETLRIALAALRAHKLRSFLTLLGVIIGVMTVVSVVSIINGLNAYVTEQIFSLNPDVFVVTQFGIITSREEFIEALKRKRITLEDAEAVERLCAGCGDVGVVNSTNQAVKHGSERLPDVQIIGGTANIAGLTNLDLEAGRFYTDIEVRHAATVAVIGSDVRDELFGKLDPIGRLVWIEGTPYKVVGLLRKQGSVLGQSQDSRVDIPLDAFRKQYGLRRSVALFIRPRDGMAGLEPAQDEVRTILRARRDTPFKAKDPFGLVTAGAVGDVWKQISAGAFALVTFISGISLLVGGVVIANIMLVSVIERTREIGIRRALGARRRDILLQFLAEAVVLSLAGGVVGVLLGFAIAKGLSTAFPLPTRVTPGLILAGLLLSVATGLLAGVFPARKAARLPPIEALRYE